MTTLVAGVPVTDLKLLPNEDYLLTTPWWDPTPSLYRVTPAGVLTTFANNYFFGGNNDAAVMPDGSIVVLNNANKNIPRFTAAGQFQDFPVPKAPQAVLQTIMPYKVAASRVRGRSL